MTVELRVVRSTPVGAAGGCTTDNLCTRRCVVYCNGRLEKRARLPRLCATGSTKDTCSAPKSSKNRRGVEIVRRRAPAKKTIAGALSFVFANIAGRITSASGPGERDRSSQLLSIPSSIRQERGLWSVSEKLVNCCYTRGFSSTAVFERSAESPSDRQAIGAGAAANPLGEDGIRFHLNLWSLVRLAHHWRWLRCTAAVVTQVYIHQYTRLAAGTSARGS